MAKRKADNFIANEDEEDDDDFVKSESEEEAISEEVQAKPRKKSKVIKDESDNEDAPVAKKPGKTEKAKTVKKPQLTEVASDGRAEDGEIVVQTAKDGGKYIDLGKKKRASINVFKGNVLLDIREFYGDESDLKPGKKGISIGLEQWEILKRSTSTIDAIFTELAK